MRTDVAVVGGGPAGAAAAIEASASGLRVMLFEREARAPRVHPGESCHPGVEPLLRTLSVFADVNTAGFLRNPGHWILAGARSARFVPYGADEGGAWKGFQLWRPTFDEILLNRAASAGVTVVRACGHVRPLLRNGAVVGVAGPQGSVEARIVIDATGRRRWLSRAMRIGSDVYGAARVAWCGYMTGSCPARDPAPVLSYDRSGWVWTAAVRPGVYQWVRTALNGQRVPKSWVPHEYARLRPLGRPAGYDVTWRIARRLAGDGYVLAGDAAFVVDPASSHGVIKALMSGIAAARHCANVIGDGADPHLSARTYTEWLQSWFVSDTDRLRQMYADMENS